MRGWVQEKEQPRVEEQGKRNGVRELVSILRKITFSVQIFPFIYTALYAVVFFVYNYAADLEPLLDLLDALFYVSPIVVIAQIVYSYILKLCVWHRVACIIPLFAEGVNLLDSYLIELTQGEIDIINYSIVVLIILYLFSAYKVFFTDDRRIC